MCGIVGLINKNGNVVNDIVSSLIKLEYRGYDSSGICISTDEGLRTIKETGKIINMQNAIPQGLKGNIGIGHTRWATHGKVTTFNAHPHFTDHVSLVHNGIIENYMDIKSDLLKDGFKFKSETDSEVIAVLITKFIISGLEFKYAFIKALKMLKGAFAIVCIGNDGRIGFAKNHSPLVVGKDGDVTAIGSDAFSVTGLVSKIMYLEDGDYGFASFDNIIIYDKNNNQTTRDYNQINLSNKNFGKDGYKHYMLKEIHEQPMILEAILNHYIDDGKINNLGLDIDFKSIGRVVFIACGTSYYSTVVSSYFFEQYARIPVETHIASEFRDRNPVLTNDALYVFVSQSGETSDTIGAMKLVKNAGMKIMSIANNEKTTMENISDYVIYCHAGPEIGVASTKAFISQVCVLLLMSLKIGYEKSIIDNKVYNDSMASIKGMAYKINDMITNINYISNIKNIASSLLKSQSMIYIGKCISYGIALEGSLKMKELSYIHSEAFTSGELKHGSIALIDESIPVIGIFGSKNLYDKISSAIESILSRNGRVVLIGRKNEIAKFDKFEDQIIGRIIIDDCDDICIPLLYTPVLQLLSYYVSDMRGYDVDQPRNLAKSVTVD
jgi:glucosamine--fructose-6-phosphate aminotransferase (isomerizing)